MLEFFIAIAIGYSVDGSPIVFDAVPVATYEECMLLTMLTPDAIKEQVPEVSIVTTSCVPSSKIGQNGI